MQETFNARELLKAHRERKAAQEAARKDARHREFVQNSVRFTIEAVRHCVDLGLARTTVEFDGGGSGSNLPFPDSEEIAWVPEVLAELDRLAPTYGWTRCESTDHHTNGYHDPRPYPALRWD